MPVYATDILHVGAQGLGALKAAPYLVPSSWPRSSPVARRISCAGPALLWSVAAFGLFTIAFGLSTNFRLSLAMLAACSVGGVDNISVVIRHVSGRRANPQPPLAGALRPSTPSSSSCSNEIGGFESRPGRQASSAPSSALSPAVSGQCLVVIATALYIPELRRLGRLSVAAPDDETEAPVHDN